MGLGRDDDWGDLKTLTIAVHDTTDTQGETMDCSTPVRVVRMRDYHTVKDAVTNDGSPGRSVITQREYAIAPSYRVDITGNDAIIAKVAEAVRKPVWQPYLGRRCCVPSAPLVRT
jgi:CRISPR system Cascade subunit CasD